MSKLWLTIALLVCSSAWSAEADWKVESAHERWISAVSFSPDGQSLARCGDDQWLKVWQSKSGELRWRARADHALTSLAWSSDGTRIITGNWRGEVQVWETESGALGATWRAHAENITHLAVSPGGTMLATASGDDRCQVWNLATQKCILTIELENEYDATCVAFSPDEKFVVVGDGEGTAKLYKIGSGELVLTFTGHQAAVSAVVYLPDGKRIVSASADQTIRIWDTATGEELHKLSGHADGVTALASDRSGKRLLSGGVDRSAILWEVANGKEFQRRTHLPSAITALAIAQDGRRIAIGGQRTLHVQEFAR